MSSEQRPRLAAPLRAVLAGVPLVFFLSAACGDAGALGPDAGWLDAASGCRSDEDCLEGRRCVFRVIPDGSGGAPADAAPDGPISDGSLRDARADTETPDAQGTLLDADHDAGRPRDADAASVDASEDGDAGAQARAYDAASSVPGPPGATPDVGTSRWAARLFGECSSTCDDAACKARLGARAECNLRSNRCEVVDCGRTVGCENRDITLYCDVPTNACYPSNGVCNATYPCPNFDGRLPAGFSVACRTPGAGLAGSCELSAPVPTITLGNNVKVLSLHSPDDGTVFESQEAIVFTYTVREAHFLLVTKALPTDAESASAFAIWGAALPRKSGLREVRWTDGFQIVAEKWQRAPGSAPIGEDLFAVIVAVDGGERPVGLTPRVVRFRVGTGWLMPGDACTADRITGGCVHPTLMMSCLEGTCARLCMQDTDCPDTEFCTFAGSLPHCVPAS